jgi:hypothetical protein
MNIEVVELVVKDVDFKMSIPLEPWTQWLGSTLNMQ